MPLSLIEDIDNLRAESTRADDQFPSLSDPPVDPNAGAIGERPPEIDERLDPPSDDFDA